LLLLLLFFLDFLSIYTVLVSGCWLLCASSLVYFVSKCVCFNKIRLDWYTDNFQTVVLSYLMLLSE